MNVQKEAARLEALKVLEDLEVRLDNAPSESEKEKLIEAIDKQRTKVLRASIDTE